MLGDPVGITDPSGLAPDGGGKDGKYPVAEDGDPITTLPDVKITAQGKHNYLNDVIIAFGNGEYIGGQPTLSGVEPGAPRLPTEDEAVLALDGIGTTEAPIASQAADITSGVISFRKGDNISGLMSLGGAIPGIGIYFNGAKWIRRAGKLLKYSDEIVDGADEGWSFYKTIRHHFASDKSSKYTKEFAKIASQYGLKLDQAWNKVWVSGLYHYSKHQDEYHDLALRVGHTKCCRL